MNKTLKANVRAAGLYLVVMLVARTSAIAQGVVHSQPAANGICAEISMTKEEAALSTDRIRYCFLTTNKAGAKIAYPRAEYFCRVGLLDAHGSNAPPTAVGRAMGSHFSDLNAFSYDRLEIVGARGSNPAHPRIEWIYNRSGAAKELPAPEAMFEFPGPGKYMLHLQFQVFEQVHRGTNFIYNLTAIPTVDVPINKQ